MTPERPGRVRYAPGSGVLAVVEDVVVFVHPDGPDARRLCALAFDPDADLGALDPASFPVGAVVAVVERRPGGRAVLRAAGVAPTVAMVRGDPTASLRFGLAPPPDTDLWVEAGVVAASGFEITGLAATSPVPGDSPPGSPPLEPGVSPPAERSTAVGHQRSASVPPPPAAGQRPMRWTVVFDDGQRVPMVQVLAVGRAPEGSPAVPAGAVPVEVAGDQVSRCHLLIGEFDGQIEVVDTDSLNGCFLEERPGATRRIPVGVPVAMEPHQRLRFGDRWLRIERSDDREADPAS